MESSSTHLLLRKSIKNNLYLYYIKFAIEEFFNLESFSSASAIYDRAQLVPKIGCFSSRQKVDER